MNPRLAFALAATALFLATPAMAGVAQKPSDSTGPMLTINQLNKACLDDEKKQCGPIYYVDWDGKVYRESNNKMNLQRSDALEGATFRAADSLDLIP